MLELEDLPHNTQVTGIELFEKLEEERVALGGKVFDILGESFADRPLQDLLARDKPAHLA
jgi:hypothetical protein